MVVFAWQWSFSLIVDFRVKPVAFLCFIGKPGEEWTESLGSGAGVWWAGCANGKPCLPD